MIFVLLSLVLLVLAIIAVIGDVKRLKELKRLQQKQELFYTLGSEYFAVNNFQMRQMYGIDDIEE